MIDCSAQLCEGKGKFVLMHAMKTYGWVEIQLHSRWVVCWKHQPLYCQGQRLCNLLNRSLIGPQIWSGHFIRETNSLLLRGFKQHFLICPSYNPVTILNLLCQLCEMQEFELFPFSSLFLCPLFSLGNSSVIIVMFVNCRYVFIQQNKTHLLQDQQMVWSTFLMSVKHVKKMLFNKHWIQNPQW